MSSHKQGEQIEVEPTRLEPNISGSRATFEEIILRVTRLLDVPVSLLVFSEGDTFRIQSCHGLDEGFCEEEKQLWNLTLESDGPLAINNLNSDERTAECGLVTASPFVRSYLGVPLGPRGRRDGVLGVFALSSREFTSEEAEILSLCARWVEREFELKDQVGLLSEKDRMLRRADELFRHTPFPLICLNGTGEVSQINRAAEVLWEAVGEGLVSEHFSRGIVGDMSIDDVVDRVIAEGPTSLDPIRVDTPEGGVFYLQPTVIADPAYDRGLIVGFLDQTDMVLSANFYENSLRPEAEETGLRNEMSFMARLSHEIRNIVGGLLGNVELWERQAPVDELFQQIKESVLSLKDLVDDTLAYDQIQRGQISVEHNVFNLKVLCDSLANSFASAARAKGLLHSYRYSASEEFFIGDPLRVRQILSNLLNNSVKYTHQGQVEFKVEDAPDGVTFFIRDSGEGMSEEFLQRVFEPYSQAVEAKDTVAGVGLGLAIVGELLKRLEGDVKIDSELNEGSVFEVYLPLQVSSDKDSNDQWEQNSLKELPSLGLTIVLADDNVINRTVMTAQLQNLGCKALAAQDGLGALDFLKERKVDLVLLDCHMPNLDGFETARKITSEPEVYGSPIIIALTASVEKQTEAKCRESGMHHYLQKPLKFLDLYQKLSDLRALGDQREGGSKSLDD